jgi:glycosyltransferase involved in cell wall biosynthesis
MSEPLVSVVTPVYNGERYLRQCIESVLAQTYTNWEYIIVNNRSTDRSLAIAEEYALGDARIRIHTNSDFVDVIRNHNVAFGLISSDSVYCKVVHADDWLFPECLTRMVEVAEIHPSVGIIGSYTLRGATVDGNGLPYPSPVVPGRALCRLTLLKETYLFWSPSCLLIRSDPIRADRDAFYKTSHLHADVEAWFEVLQDWDFGFVHQVLTFVRTHEGSVSASRADRLNTYLPAWLNMLVRYGPACMSGDEYRALLRRKVREYYRFLGRSIFRWKDREFWEYHASMLRDLGYPFSWVRVVSSSVMEGLCIASYPTKAVGKAVGFLRHGSGPGPA